MAVLTVEPVDVRGELARRGYFMATPDITPVVPDPHTVAHDPVSIVHNPGIHVPIDVPGGVDDIIPVVDVPVLHIPIIPHVDVPHIPIVVEVPVLPPPGPAPHLPIVLVPDLHIPFETQASRYAKFLQYLPYLVALMPEKWVLELTRGGSYG